MLQKRVSFYLLDERDSSLSPYLALMIRFRSFFIEHETNWSIEEIIIFLMIYIQGHSWLNVNWLWFQCKICPMLKMG